VPSVDLDGLPDPVNEPAQFRFLHYHGSPELHYALFCLAVFGSNRDIAKQLYRAVHWRFEGQNSEDLAETSLAITGLAFSLHLMGMAHTTALDWLLDPKTVTHLHDPHPRALSRAISTFSYWWGFQGVMSDTFRLAQILEIPRSPEGFESTQPQP